MLVISSGKFPTTAMHPSAVWATVGRRVFFTFIGLATTLSTSYFHMMASFSYSSSSIDMICLASILTG